MADIKGTEKADALTGTTLQDTVHAKAGADTVDGGEGDDDISAGADDDMVFGGAGNDFILAGTGNDTVDGGEGNDTVHAGEGEDLVYGSYGNDVLTGGKGFDTIDYTNFEDSVEVDLGKGTMTAWDTAQSVQGFEKVIGGAYNDILKGSEVADVIMGGDGHDVLRGKGGVDELTGGNGFDLFQWKVADLLNADGTHRGLDTIEDFTSQDTFDLSMLLEGASYTKLSEVVKFTNTGVDSILQVKINDAFVDVATIEGRSFGNSDVDILATTAMFLT